MILELGRIIIVEKFGESELWVEMLQANEGDCLLITIPAANKRILIDGGTKQTYENSLRERLLNLKQEGKKIDLLVVTHIDNDHIGGIIELLKENGSAIEAKIVEIENIWHNSYRHLQFDRINKLGEKEELLLRKIVANGQSNEQLHNLTGEKSISAIQGTTLAAMILAGGYSWNRHFNGLAVSSIAENIDLGNGCKIRVILPREKELVKLAKKWKRELQYSKIGFRFSDDMLFDDAYEYFWRYYSEETIGESKEIRADIRSEKEKKSLEELALFQGGSDNSETNQSSVSLIIEYSDKRILLPADNVAENVMEILLKENRTFDAVKLPHHGSINNITDDFIKRIDTSKYLISTSSEKYCHPDLESIAKIVCKKTEYEKKIYFNYKIDKICDFEKEMVAIENTEFIHLNKGQKIVL